MRATYYKSGAVSRKTYFIEQEYLTQSRKGAKFHSRPLQTRRYAALASNSFILQAMNDVPSLVVTTCNDVAKIVVDTALHIHRRLGPGLLESVYLVVLAHELRKRGLQVEVEVPVPIVWDGLTLDVGFRADMIVAGLLIVELKSIEVTAPVHKKQLLTYLRLADKRLGLLINFGTALLKDGISRVVNGLPE
jgi:GxxExxY protein